MQSVFNHSDKIREYLASLVAFRSVSSASNLDIIEYLERFFQSIGAHIYIKHSLDNKKANIVATMGPRVSGGVILSAHTDVVPVEGQDWLSDPFCLTQKEQRLYARGSCDMKGFIACCLALAGEIKNRATSLSRPLHFVFSYDEEIGCLGAKKLPEYFEKLDYKPSCALIGEPTNMKIADCHKSCSEYAIQCFGVAGHGSDPFSGANGIVVASSIIQGLAEIQNKLKQRAKLDNEFARRFYPACSSLNIGEIKGGIGRNIVPDKCWLGFDFRAINKDDKEFFFNSLEELVQQQIAKFNLDDNLKPKFQIISEIEGLEMKPENKMRDMLCNITGNNETIAVAYGTEAGIFQQMGFDTVIMGPGSIQQAHRPNEFVETSQLDKCYNTLVKIVDNM